LGRGERKKMKTVSLTKEKIVLKPSKKDENWRAFVFDIDIIPYESHKPEPKEIVIQKKVGSYLRSWSMPWKIFLKQTCIGTTLILNKSDLQYESHRIIRSK
jgi:hypothetical protein